MKIKAISLAILSIFLFSCEKKEEQKGETGQTTVEQKSLGSFDRDKVAAEVKERFESANINNNQLLQDQFVKNPAGGLKELSFKTDNYQVKEGGATADGVLTLELAPGQNMLDKPVQVKFKADINYNPELYQKGIVAQIDYKPEITPELQQQFSASDEEVKLLQGALNKLVMQTNLLADHKQQEIVAIEPFDEKDQLFAGQLEPDLTFNFKGFRMEKAFDAREFKENFNVGQSKIEFKGFDLKNKNLSFNINPFNGSSDINKDGNGSFKIDKMLFSLTDEQNVVRNFSVGAVDGQLKDYKFDQDFFSNLGKVEISVKDVAVEAPETKGLLKLFDMNLRQDTSKDANKLANGSIAIDYLVNGEEIAQKFMWPLVVNKVDLNFDFQRFNYPAFMDWIGKMNDQQQEMVKRGEMPPELQESGWKLVEDVLQKETAYGFKLNAETNAGIVKGDLSVKARKDGDLNNFKQALATSNASPGDRDADRAFGQALLALVDVNASFEVPKALLDVFGATKTVEVMGKQYLTSDENSFKFSFVNDKNGMKINGNAIDLNQLNGQKTPAK